jgi:hypothetical protein
MSNYCRACGVEIPEGQSHCSMCMGDPNHGRDRYYEQWLEHQEQRRLTEKEMEREK